VADSEVEQRSWQEIGEKLKSLLAEDRRGDAVELALTTGIARRTEECGPPRLAPPTGRVYGSDVEGTSA
jgi:hypothetical protein